MTETTEPEECPPECIQGRARRSELPAWRHHTGGGGYVDYKTPEGAQSAAERFGGTVEPIRQDAG